MPLALAPGRGRRKIAALAAAVSCACAPRPEPARPPNAIVVAHAPLQPRSATPPPSRAGSSCVVRGDGDSYMQGDVTIYADQAASQPLATIRNDRGVAAAWSGFAELADAEQHMAAIRIGGQRLARVEGFARVGRRELLLRRDFELAGRNAVLPFGTELPPVRSEEGNWLNVSVVTELVSPKELSASIPCREIRWGDVGYEAPRTRMWKEHAMRSNRINLLDAPAGKPVFEIEFDKPRGLERLDAREGFIEVTFWAGAKFRGWVHEAELVSPATGRGSGSGGGGTHRAPRIRGKPRLIPIATVEYDTPLLLGEDNPITVGTIEAGAIVRPGAARGDLVSFSFDNDALQPPDGQQFLVHADALGNQREEDRRLGWYPPDLPRVDEDHEP